ncbi:Fur family transcriptional regulator [Clostridium tyrobutyricum]|uniref:Fur family transcriptional regulator n=1 Tax=Clostridium tyrobutyricum TaxID=1519 RepID=UPI0010AA2EF5|nr:Fur family transcriptional regulator [Clostridium tyrobutyricum]MBV4422739.1 transcriptional repressor [Clostridium tyrobutyricum]QCH26708.1 Peroxide operon regulator [Clostridium tyrobutyricum]
MNDIEECLRKYNIKVTKPRVNILEIFFKSNNAITAEDIFNKCKLKNVNVDISTIYRSLDLFEAKKIIKKFDLGLNKSAYAIIRKKHKHIIQCKLCHKKVEIDCPMQEIEEIIKSKTGFVLSDSDEKLDFKLDGICEECRNKLLKEHIKI